MNEVVSHWTSVVNGRTRKIKFVHHLISGRRQLYIDDQLVRKTGYKLDLCGQEHVYHDGHKFEVLIGAKSVFELQYFLFIDGQSPEDYSRTEQRKHVYWRVKVHQKEYLIGFESETLNITLDGTLIECENSFSDNGSRICFTVDGEDYYVDLQKCIQRSSPRGVLFSVKNGEEIPEITTYS